MEQRTPFISQAGVLRLSPLTKAVSARSSATPGNVDANRPNNLNGRSKTSSVNGAAGAEKSTKPTPKKIAVAQEAAAAGDQASIDWLKALGIAVGTGVAGTAAYLALRNKGNKGPNGKNFGAENVDVTAAPRNTSTAVARRNPTVTPLTDFEVIPNTYLENPVRALPAPTPQPRLPSRSTEALRNIRRIR